MILLFLLATSACGERRSFDERYDDAASNIQERMNRLDAELDDPAPAEANAS